MKLFQIVFFAAFLLPVDGSAQDVLRSHQINSLKGLESVAIVFTASDESQALSNIRDLGDSIEVMLAKDAPRLKIAEDPGNGVPWLRVSYNVRQQGGGVFTLTLYRWVKLNSADLFAPVWTSYQGWFGASTSGTSQVVRETLQTLLTRFAADYIRANPN